MKKLFVALPLLVVLLATTSNFAQLVSANYVPPHSVTGELPRPYAEVSLKISSATELERLVALPLDVDHFHPRIGINRITLPTGEISLLRDAGFFPEVHTYDLASFIEERNLRDAELYAGTTFEKTTAGFELGSMGGFYTYAEVLQQLDEMRASYPQLITERFSIGTTAEGRTIWAVKISDNPSVDESAAEAPVYFDALHHAREPASMATVINFMFHVLENYASDPRMTYLVDNREIFIVPVVNPDGYEYNRQTNPNGGGMWRKNRRVNSGTSCRGVDINRNYNSDWGGGGSSSNACSDTYRGASPFSELESRAVRDFTTSIGASVAYTTHTSGGYWLGPDFSNGQQEFAIHAEFASDCLDENEYIYGDAAILLGYASGTTQNWMYETLGSIAWTPEIGTTGFWPSIPEIIPLVNQQIKAYEYACWVAGALADYQGFEVLNPEGLSVGQDLQLNVVIKNKGLSRPAQNVTVSLTSDNPGVTPTTDTLGYGNIASRALATNTNPFTFSVDPSVAVGTLVTFTVTVTQEGVTSDEDTFQLVVGQPSLLFGDDAESGSAAWANGGSGSNWQTSDEDAYTGNNCFADSRLGHTASNNSRGFGMASSISLQGVTEPRLEFAAKWGLHTTTDYVRLQISTNNGGSWTSLATSATETIGGQPAFVENESWTYQVVDLSAYAGQSVRFRFLSVSNGGLRSDGFYFDDFRIVDYNSGAPVETCTDGIQNGDETGVDCGGSCTPCSTGCTPVTILSDDFEAGYGNWTDGGSDCIRTSNTTYANSGSISVLIRDNTSTSVLTTSDLDLSAYDEITVDFTYYPLSMDNASEDFWLQVSTNGGGSYVTREEWNQGDEFQNGNRYFESVTLAGPFTTNTRIRFRCDASANADYIYLDDIVLSACAGGGGPVANCTDGIQNGGETGIDCGGPDCAPCESCTDGIQNGNETGIDCGGPDCAPCVAVTYCGSQGNNTQYEHIQSVTVAGTTNTSGNNGGYGDFTGSVSIGLAAGTASVSLTPGFNGSAYAEGWVIYVDYNADGDFADGGERVLQLSGSGTVSGNFTVPAGLSGTSRMRIQMQYNAFTAGGCDTYTYGEVEDYAVSFGGGASQRGPQVSLLPGGAPSGATVFPNPASDNITVLFSISTPHTELPWTIIDATGREVRAGITSDETLRNGMRVGLSGLAAGVYYFSLRIGDRTDAQRFVLRP